MAVPESIGQAVIDPRHFRTVLGQYPTGVCVITAMAEDGGAMAMVVGSFTSVSLDPPLVGFLPDKKSGSWAQLRLAKRFCVNILSIEQEDVCRKLASKNPDKFQGIPHRLSPLGSPIIDDVVAWIDCEAYAVQDAGDHDIALGLVHQLQTEGDALPLLFFQGGYGRFSPSSLAAADAGGLLTEQLRLVDRGRAEMEALTEEVSARCIAPVVVDSEVVILASAGQVQRSSPPTLVGQRLPFRPPTGAVFAAWLPEAEQNAWIGAHGEGERGERYRASLGTVRKRGYSVGLVNDAQRAFAAKLTEMAQASGTEPVEDLDRLIEDLEYDPVALTSENCPYVRVISAPVFDGDGRVALALTLYGFAKPNSVEDVERLVGRLIQSAQAISERIQS